MTGYPSSPEGLSQAARREAGVIADAKAGSAKGTSRTYSDAGNIASPDVSTIARNEINKPGGAKPAGSTSDTGRAKP